MTQEIEIIFGVRCDAWMFDASFERGSIEGLAAAVRQALWSRRNLFEEGEVLVVSVCGDREEARDDPIEVKTWHSDRSSSRLSVPRSLEEELSAAREANMPGSEYAVWPCDCEEYCDQDHGEGSVDLYVEKPSYHELAAMVGMSNAAR